MDLDGAAWMLELEDALMPADYLPTIQHLSVAQEWAHQWTPQLGSLFSLTVGDQRGLGSLQAIHRLGYSFANGTRLEWALSSQNTSGAAKHGTTLALQHSLGHGIALSVQSSLLLGDQIAIAPQASLSKVWREKHLTSLTMLPRGIAFSYAFMDEEQTIQASWQHIGDSTALDLKGAVKVDDQYSLKSRLRVTEDSSQLDLGVIRIFSSHRLSLWLEMNSSWGVGLRLSLKRDPYSFTLPIRVSSDLHAQSIGWAVLIPTVIGWLTDQLSRQLQSEELTALRAQQQHEAMLPILKEQAMLVHELMRPVCEEREAVQQNTNGLIITSAWYRSTKESLDVRIPLSMLIHDGTLVLPAGPKDHLAGFIDVQLGHEKVLEISYRFRGQEHHVSQDAQLPLRLPQRHHIK